MIERGNPLSTVTKVTSEIWRNVETQVREARQWQVWHRWWYGLWHRHRIEPFSKITFNHKQSEWPIAKDVGLFSKRCNARHRQTFYDLVNVYVFDIGRICIHGKELLRQFAFHQKIQGKYHLKANVRDIWTVDIGTIRWDFLVSQISWESSPSKMKKSSVSRMQRFVYSQILCYVLERWIRNQHQILFGKNSWVGSTVHHNTELWTQFTESRWNSSGIFFPAFTSLQFIKKVHELMSKMGDTSQFQGRIIFMSMFDDIIWWNKDNEKECFANATLVSLF